MAGNHFAVCIKDLSLQLRPQGEKQDERRGTQVFTPTREMPYVKTMTRDHRIGARDEGQSIAIRDFAEARLAIEALNGRERTQVLLEGPNKALIIGGGNGGQYNVIIAIETDRAFLNLLNSSDQPAIPQRLVSGGQEGIYDGTRCVDLRTVLRAAAVFFETGESASDLVWEGD